MIDMHNEGAGACVQILMFSIAAIELKRKAPGAHTFLERETFLC
jgi:urea-proton symporter